MHDVTIEMSSLEGCLWNLSALGAILVSKQLSWPHATSSPVHSTKIVSGKILRRVALDSTTHRKILWPTKSRLWLEKASEIPKKSQRVLIGFECDSISGIASEIIDCRHYGRQEASSFGF